MPRVCLVAEVQEGKLAQYKHYHDNIFPEVVRGLTKAGVTVLQIFQVPGTNRLVMFVETEEGVDLGKATGKGSAYREDARAREWEEMMETDFHNGWTVCEEIHSSHVHWKHALACEGPGGGGRDS